MKKKIVSLVLVFALALALGIGGTVAWLTAETGSVVNTFTVGDINITLEETTGTDYAYVPGDTKAKDPTVTVLKDSEPCYVFVKITETNNEFTSDPNGKFVNYTVASPWAALNGVKGVYWCKVENKLAADKAFPVLTNNQVTISSAITETVAETVLENTKPTLTFTAYAIQSANLPTDTAAYAWSQITSVTP